MGGLFPRSSLQNDPIYVSIYDNIKLSLETHDFKFIRNVLHRHRGVLGISLVNQVRAHVYAIFMLLFQHEHVQQALVMHAPKVLVLNVVALVGFETENENVVPQDSAAGDSANQSKITRMEEENLFPQILYPSRHTY